MSIDPSLDARILPDHNAMLVEHICLIDCSSQAPRYHHYTVLYSLDVPLELPGNVSVTKDNSIESRHLPIRDGLVPQPNLMLPRASIVVDKVVPKHFSRHGFLPRESVICFFETLRQPDTLICGTSDILSLT